MAHAHAPLNLAPTPPSGSKPSQSGPNMTTAGSSAGRRLVTKSLSPFPAFPLDLEPGQAHTDMMGAGGSEQDPLDRMQDIHGAKSSPRLANVVMAAMRVHMAKSKVLQAYDMSVLPATAAKGGAKKGKGKGKAKKGKKGKKGKGKERLQGRDLELAVMSKLKECAVLGESPESHDPTQGQASGKRETKVKKARKGKAKGKGKKAGRNASEASRPASTASALSAAMKATTTPGAVQEAGLQGEAVPQKPEASARQVKDRTTRASGKDEASSSAANSCRHPQPENLSKEEVADWQDFTQVGMMNAAEHRVAWLDPVPNDAWQADSMDMGATVDSDNDDDSLLGPEHGPAHVTSLWGRTLKNMDDTMMAVAPPRVHLPLSPSPRASQALAHTFRCSDSIDLSHHSVGADIIDAVAERINASASASHVNLERTGASRRQMDHLLGCIPSACEMRDLVLSGSPFTPKALASVLDNAGQQLVSLALNRCKLGDSGTKVLCNALRGLGGLQTLSLRENGITRRSADVLGVLIAECTPLRDLRLGWNTLTDASMPAICHALLHSSSAIRTLDLSANRLGSSARGGARPREPPPSPQTVQHGATAPEAGPDAHQSATLDALVRQSSTLVHLDLSTNQFTHDDVVRLAAALDSNTSLVGLHFDDNAHGVVDTFGTLKPLQGSGPQAILLHQHKSAPCPLCNMHRCVSFRFKADDQLASSTEEVRLVLSSDHWTHNHEGVQEAPGVWHFQRLVPNETVEFCFLIQSPSTTRAEASAGSDAEANCSNSKNPTDARSPHTDDSLRVATSTDYPTRELHLKEGPNGHTAAVRALIAKAPGGGALRVNVLETAATAPAVPCHGELLKDCDLDSALHAFDGAAIRGRGKELGADVRGGT